MQSPEQIAAAIWFAAGVTPIPIRTDGSKAPALATWRDHHTMRPTSPDWLGQFTGNEGIAVLTGSTAGHLEMLEFEGLAMRENMAEHLSDIAKAAGLGELLDRVIAGYYETTPKGGVHLFYRVIPEPADPTSPAIPVTANVKLAERPARADEYTPEESQRVETARVAGREVVIKRTLIETRGQGGYVIVAPSRAECSDPRGPYGQQPWSHSWGHPSTIATITAAERRELHALCRSMHVAPVRAAPPERPLTGSTLFDGGAERPGDVYARTHSWAAILEPFGWRRLYEYGGKTYWCRPGKETGVSATTTDTGPGDPGGLWVFSTSTEFEAETLYTKFGAFAHLEHGGNMSAAASELVGGPSAPMPMLSPYAPPWMAETLGIWTAAPVATDAGVTSSPPAANGVGTAEPVDPTNPFAMATAKLAAKLKMSSGLDAIELPHYIVEGWLQRNEIAQIIGPSGSMKTFVALQLALCIATGTDFYGAKVEKLNTMFVAAEGSSGIRKRVRAWEKHNSRRADALGVLDVPVQIVARAGRELVPSIEWQALIGIVRDAGVKVLFVDTQARSTVGVNENDNSEMGAVFEAIDMMRRATGCTVVLIHHTGKSGTTGRGASSMYAAVNTEISVNKRELPGGAKQITVANTKNKDDESALTLALNPQRIELEPRDLTYDGSIRAGDETTTSLVLLKAKFAAPANGAPAVDKPAPNTSARIDAVLSAFLATIGDTRQSASKAEIRAACEWMPKTSFYEAWNQALERRLIKGGAPGKRDFTITDVGRRAVEPVSGLPESPETEETP